MSQIPLHKSPIFFLPKTPYYFFPSQYILSTMYNTCILQMMKKKKKRRRITVKSSCCMPQTCGEKRLSFSFRGLDMSFLAIQLSTGLHTCSKNILRRQNSSKNNLYLKNIHRYLSSFFKIGLVYNNTLYINFFIFLRLCQGESHKIHRDIVLQ